MHKNSIMIPPIWLLLAIFVQFVLHFSCPILDCPSDNSKYGGILIVATGIILIVWAIKSFIQAGTPIRPFQKVISLVSSGPYRFTRNPMYLGFLIILFGIAAGMGSLAPFIVLPIFFVFVQRHFVFREEALMQEQFGTSYADYCSRVKRWI